MNLQKLANSLGVDLSEVREKQKLMDTIRSTRKNLGWSQVQLAEKVGVSQSRIAQIESGVGTQRVTFDVLFGILCALGHDYKITTHKIA